MRFNCLIMTLFLSLAGTVGAFAQQRTVTGTVRDTKQEPVVGAGVLIEGTTRGTVTGVDGSFSLAVPAGTVILDVSSLGYSPQKVTVSPGQAVVSVILEEDAMNLEGTVVVGYGVQKKINLTGAISSVTSETLENRVAPTLTHMLQGSVPGLNVTTSSGRPGNTASINIRGINSINGGSPLVLVDGVEGDLSRVNPADVESISVIKDASAAAIYGARASFGVVLVTTKTGASKDGYARVQVSSRMGWQEPTTSTDFETRGYYSVYLNDLFFRAYNGKNYTTYTEEDMAQLWARVNDTVENPERPWVMIDQRAGRDTYVYYANTDWWHELFQDRRPNMQHSVSLSGGTEHVKYFLSGAYNYEEGLFRRNTDKLNKYNFRSKLVFDINKWMSVSNNTSFYKYQYT
ncbi:MAG: SusC/RagA family TonB-linked outer membrane protein, partial [Bacteroidales bacterium]|nr:SusC/RagA family TonB-linked outer membrane protein [Bacteroidales bacterium]